MTETSSPAPRRFSPGDDLPGPSVRADMLDYLLMRRSTTAAYLDGKGPDADQLQDILHASARAPDHGKLGPWRFIVFEGEARAQFGSVLEDAYRNRDPNADDHRLDMERGRFTRAPVVIAVVSRVTENIKIPEWEQILSAGAVCQNMLIAAGALGFGAQWLSEWYAYDAKVKAALGLQSGERIAGFVYIGAPTDKLMERPRADIDSRIEWYAP